jgi:TRAP-type C4-dicarboxylate transport system substrate-binding protein
MEDDEESLTKKLADGGMTVTPEQPADIDVGMKAISAYWDEWAKTKGPDAVTALKQVRAALGR